MSADKLGLMDQLFYKAEQYRVANMVMGGASILEPASKGERLRGRAIADHIASRLEQVPLLRRKFVQDPLRLGSVKTIEDPEFDIDEHLSVEKIPAPGGDNQLAAAIGDVSSRPLDVRHLWHWTVLEGLRGGRVAVVCRMHHALFDGLGAMQVLSSMYDTEPVKPRRPQGRREPVADAPGSYALLGSAVAETLRRVWVDTPRFLRHNTGPILSSLAGGIRAVVSGEAPTMPEVQATAFNTEGSSNLRSVAYRTLSLPEVKQLARHFGCKVNDIAMLLYSFALQYYLDETGQGVDFDLWCGMPISTRSENSTAGNQVTTARINLHNTIADVRERLAAIQTDTARSKQSARPDNPAVDVAALGALVAPPLLDGMMWLLARFDLMGRTGTRMPMVNALLSNVPGPPETLYIGNGRLVESIPLIPALDIVAVSGGITSVGDSITIGFHCDREAVPEPGLLAAGVDRGMAELRTAAGVKGRQVGRKPRGKKAAKAR